MLRGNHRLSQVSASPPLSIRLVLRPRSDQRFRPIRNADVVPANGTAETPTLNLFSRLNSKAFGLLVYASQGGLLTHHATLSSGGWSTLPGRLVLKGSQREAFDAKASFVLSRTSWRTPVASFLVPPFFEVLYWFQGDRHCFFGDGLSFFSPRPQQRYRQVGHRRPYLAQAGAKKNVLVLVPPTILNQVQPTLDLPMTRCQRKKTLRRHRQRTHKVTFLTRLSLPVLPNFSNDTDQRSTVRHLPRFANKLRVHRVDRNLADNHAASFFSTFLKIFGLSGFSQSTSANVWTMASSSVG